MRRLAQDYLVECIHKSQLEFEAPDGFWTLVRHPSVQVGDHVAEKILRGVHARVRDDDLREIGTLFFGERLAGRRAGGAWSAEQNESSHDERQRRCGDQNKNGS